MHRCGANDRHRAESFEHAGGATTHGQARLSLLGSFELSCGGRDVQLPMSACRLLAFLALREHPVSRAYAADMLWLEVPCDRAHANLRNTLWRIHRAGLALVDRRGEQLRLSKDVHVDVHEARAYAHRLLSGEDLGQVELAATGLTDELLPDWYDDWLTIQREGFHQLRLHALEALAERLIEAGYPARALDPGFAAIAADPLRETPHRLVIRIHLAEGNRREAMRQYDFYRRIVGEQLGLAPSPRMDALVDGLSLHGDGAKTFRRR
jgi:DNA-binding SARP family transcriptional activator